MGGLVGDGNDSDDGGDGVDDDVGVRRDGDDTWHPICRNPLTVSFFPLRGSNW